MTAPTKLYGKLLEIFRAVDRLEKGGYNEAQRYNYVEASAVFAAIRTKMAELGVIFSLDVSEVTHFPYESKSGAQQFLTTAALSGTFIDAESGESYPVNFYGTGADSGDKGLYKAITGGLKYLFLGGNLIPTGDDPEVPRDDERPASRQRKSSAKAAPQPVEKKATKAQLDALGEAFKQHGLAGRQIGMAIFRALGEAKVSSELTSADVATVTEALGNPDVVAAALEVLPDGPAAH